LATATLRLALASLIVRDTSVALSIARSVMLGCSVGPDPSNSTCGPFATEPMDRQRFAIRA
jgi:hypothetical protein